MLPEVFKPYLRIIVYVIFGWFAYFVASQGYLLSMKIFGFSQQSSALGIPMGFVYLGPAVGFSLVCFRLLQEIIKELKLIKGAK